MFDKVSEFLSRVSKLSVEEIEVETKDLRIRAKFGKAKPANSKSESKSLPQVVEPVTEKKEKKNYYKVKAPMIGTFYRAPSPGSKPFVSEGDFVEKGQTLCIIEALKVMNEIESEKSGIVRKVLVEDGQAVEYGEPLFYIEEKADNGI